VLELLADEPTGSGLGVVRLAELRGDDKSQLSRTLTTLAEHGYVERDPESLAYRLGWRVYALAARAGDGRLLAAAAPVLRMLVRELAESVHLSVRQGSHVLTLLAEAPPHAIHAPGRVGGLTPVGTTSAGRVLVSELEPEALAALGLAALEPELEVVRASGYAIVRNVFEPGLVAAAAPVRGPSGAIVAAVNVSGPGFRFDGRLEEAAVVLVAAGRELSVAIGGR
jgi:DNA-binding IclR family transcriptional regulator